VEIYLVGGAVRDELLGREVTERDWVVVGGTPQEMLDQGYRKVGKDFPVFLHPETNEEYALARTERKSGKGYMGFECYASPYVSLEDDLNRRDLTVNSMAKSKDGEIVDPYGGQEDLKNHVLRHVSPAFEEDPLRVLRVARFSARLADEKFKIADETKILMLKMVRSGELNELVSERVWVEFDRALSEKNPEVFIEVLRECGGLEVLFPELNNLFGVPQNKDKFSDSDVGFHALQLLNDAAKKNLDNSIRFSALFHGIGKAKTKTSDWPDHPDYTHAGLELFKQFGKRFTIPKEYQELAQLVIHFHIGFIHAFDLTPDGLINLLEHADAFRRYERFEKFLSACEIIDSEIKNTHANKNTEHLKKIFTLANEISAQDVIKDGFEGKDISVELRKRRVTKVEELQGGSVLPNKIKET